jgi:DNA-binding IclR family transcriptional regulator
LVRGLQLLELIAQRQCGCSAKWLSLASGIHLSTCYHLLNSLVHAGYIQKDKHLQEYTLTDKVAHLNNLFQNQHNIPHPIKILAQSLVHNTGETAYVATWVSGEIVLTYIAEGTRSVKVRLLYVGYKEHAFLRALGKAVLAHLPPEELKAYYTTHPPLARTLNSRTSWQEIQEDLHDVCERGYAINDEEFEVGVCSIGAPIYQFDNSIWGAMSISIPSVRFNSEDKALIAFVQGQALTASFSLGYASTSGNNSFPFGHSSKDEYS